MKASWKTGLSFGLTSGVITTLGLMVGLHAGTHSRAVVLGGILTIAVADALSDSMGIHLAEESKNSGPAGDIWEATLATFAAKFVIAGTFVVPVAVRPLDQAIVISVVWGLFLLTGAQFLCRAGSSHSAVESHRRASPHRPVCCDDYPCGGRVGARSRGGGMIDARRNR